MGNYLSRRSAEERLEARVAYLEAENASLRRAASRGDLRAPHHRPRLPSWDWEFRIPSDVLILCLSRVPFDDLGSVRACCGRWHRIAREESFALERRRSGFAESRLIVGFNVANCGENCGDAGDAPPPDRWWALTLARGGAGEVIRAEPLPPAPRRARAASHALVADPPVPGVALFGGEGAVGEANVPLRLDVARRRWTALAETAVDHLAYRAAGSVGGRLYLCGGLFFGGDASPRFEAGVQVLEGAGPALGAPGAWAELAPMPSPASGGHTAALGGLLYVFGGYERLGSPMGAMLAFDPAAGTWARLPRVPASCVATAAAFGGELHVLAGDDDEDPDEEDNKATHHFIYDPGAAAWRQGDALPRDLTPRRNNNGLHSPAVLVALDDRLALITFQLPARDYRSLGLHTWTRRAAWARADATAFTSALDDAMPRRETPTMEHWSSDLGRGRLFSASACYLG